jgi:hypothetical protein
MRRLHRWRWTLVSFAGGCAIFGLAAANGQAWETVWLPAVMLGAAWPHGVDGGLRRCLRHLRPGRDDPA